jgi:hypothetical protein
MQLSIKQIAALMQVVDPFLHMALFAGVVLILFEVAVLLGDLVGSRDRDSHG